MGVTQVYWTNTLLQGHVYKEVIQNPTINLTYIIKYEIQMYLCRTRGVWGNKKIVERYVLILFTDFNKHLDIQTDMRNYQLRVMINHDK